MIKVGPFIFYEKYEMSSYATKLRHPYVPGDGSNRLVVYYPWAMTNNEEHVYIKILFLL